MTGGEGVDAARYWSHPGPVSVTLDGAPDDGPPGRGDNIAADVEDVRGSGQDDALFGSEAPNRLDGGNGRDMLASAGGDDVIDEREFVDCGEGGSCPDPQSDTISCGDGRDTVDGDATDVIAADCELVVRDGRIVLTSGDDVFSAFREELTIVGGAGDDRISGQGYDRLEGNSGDDVLRVGPAGDNTARGGSGNDVLSGNRAEDRLLGGTANDRINGRGAKDAIDGGPGRDLLSGGSGNDRIVARERRAERDRVSCDSGRDTVIADRRDVVSRTCERVIRR